MSRRTIERMLEGTGIGLPDRIGDWRALAVSLDRWLQGDKFEHPFLELDEENSVIVDTRVYDRIQRILEAAAESASSWREKSILGSMAIGTTVEGELTVVGDWNAGPTVERVRDILDHMGIAISYDDEVASCSGCGRLVNTVPQYMGWTPDYIIEEGALYCEECVDSDLDSYFAGLAGQSDELVNSRFDPGDGGYELAGHYYGSAFDRRHRIEEELREAGVYNYLFRETRRGFEVWVHQDEDFDQEWFDEEVLPHSRMD